VSARCAPHAYLNCEVEVDSWSLLPQTAVRRDGAARGSCSRAGGGL
jgi:hypothetical protein